MVTASASEEMFTSGAVAVTVVGVLLFIGIGIFVVIAIVLR